MRTHNGRANSLGFAHLALCLLLSLAFVLTLPSLALGEDGRASLSASGVVNRSISVDPTERREGYSAVLYDNTSGLPTSEANAIAETSEGFIWIGSYSGLIRYDGNSFVRMDSTTGIASVTSLYVDSKNRLWIGTNDAGIAMMERNEYHHWGEDDGLTSLQIICIAEDDTGTIYVGTATGVAMIDAKLQLSPLDDARINDIYIESLRKGSDGLVYGLTRSGDLFSIQNGSVVTYLDHEASGLKGITHALPDPNNPGYLYLGTETSEVLYGKLGDQFENMTTSDITPLSTVYSMEYIDGEVWICTRNGIGVLGEDGFRQLEHVPLDNSVGPMMTDYAGNLWFTSSRQGVMKIVPNQFSDLFDRYDLPETVVNTTCKYDEQLFIGTDDGLMVIGQDGPVNSVPLTRASTASGTDLGATDLIQMLEGHRIRSIIRDSQGRLWIATWQSDGLLRYDHGEVLAFTEEDGLMSNRVRVACERSDGSMLVVNTGGISVIEGDRVTKNYDKDAGISILEGLSVCEGFHDDIVVGSDGGGIYVISDEGTKNITTKDGLPSGIIMRVKRDDARRIIWIVASNSLAYMTEDYRVTTIKEFPYSNNFDLIENSKGDMWVLSSNGIYVVPTDELLANGRIAPVYYSMSNGLSGITTANAYSELTPEGDLYIAASTGVVKVNIEESLENVDNLKVAVPYIDADGERIYPDENGVFHIPSHTDKLTVSSFVYTYSLTDPLVSYQLKGFEDESSTINRSDLVPVDYTNLRGGNYEFIIRLMDSMGRDSREVSVRIVKQKAFYERTWFYLVSGLILLILLGIGVRVYVRRKTRTLEKRNQETMTFVREITEAFAKVIDMKDRYTNGHSTRVARYTAMLTRELGYDEETVERFYRIALLHDIGKVGVPQEVLNKPGKLTDEEFEIIKSHTTQGYEALKDISIMPELAVGAQAHHERPDGHGYPNHLLGKDIPRVAQIIAVADCFDAMYSNRPYRKRMNFEKAVSIIREVSGTQLTADVVDAFLRLVERGEFRAPDDTGGGTTENIENIRKGTTTEDGGEDS